MRQWKQEYDPNTRMHVPHWMRQHANAATSDRFEKPASHSGQIFGSPWSENRRKSQSRSRSPVFEDPANAAHKPAANVFLFELVHNFDLIN